MTVSSDTSRSGPYTGNGLSTVFAYGFQILDESHLRVVKLGADGTEADLALNSDYTVSGVGDSNGGNIAVAVAPVSGETITIVRNIPLTQGTDFENQGAYFAQTHEDAFDKLAMQVQQVNEKADRAVKVRVSDETTDPDALVENIAASEIVAVSAASSASASEAAAAASEAAAAESAASVDVSLSGTNTFTGQFRIQRDTPLIQMKETDGSLTHNTAWFVTAGDVRKHQTRDNDDQFVSDDYCATVTDSGVSEHKWLIGNNDAVRITAAGLETWNGSSWNAVGGAMPVGSIHWCPYENPYPGCIMLNDQRQSLSRSTFSDLWDWISANAGEALAVSEAVAEDGQFGPGDGSTTFTLPKAAGYFLRAKGGIDPDLRVLGDVQGDAIRNITGELSRTTPVDISNIFNQGNGALGIVQTSRSTYVTTGSGGATSPTGVDFDTSRIVPTADENRPKNIAYNICIVAFQSVDNAAQVYAAAVVAEQVSQGSRILGLEGIALLENRQAEGVSGGSTVGGSWQTYPINTETSDPRGLVSLSSNEFLVTKDCTADFWVTFYSTRYSVARMFNVTDSIEVGKSTNVYARNTDPHTIVSLGSAELRAGKTYRVEYQTELTISNGLGLSSITEFAAGDEVYGGVKLRAAA